MGAPDIFGVSLVNHSVKEMAGVPLISLSETPLIGGAALAKDVMDKSFAIVALILLSPVMLATAIAIKLTSRGPVLFHQKRHGWDGRILEIYKFRSMKVNAETRTHESHVANLMQTNSPMAKMDEFGDPRIIPGLFSESDGSR